MKKAFHVVALAAALVAAAPARAQFAPAWTHEGGFVSVAADATGLYATRRGTPFIPEFDNVYQVWNYPAATVRLDPAGVQVWAQDHAGFWPSHDVNIIPADVAVGADGGVYAVHTEYCTSGFHSNGVVVRYDAAGGLAFGATYKIGMWNYPYAIATDAAGNSYVGAQILIGGSFGPWTYRAGVVKYDPSGAPIPGPGTQDGTAFPTIELREPFETAYPGRFDVAVDANQDVFVTGAGGTLKFDGGTFAQIWVAPFVGAQVVAAGDGGAFVTGPNGTVRLSAAGELLWTAAPGLQLDPANGGIVVTDGARTVQYGADGALLWSIPVGGSDVAFDGENHVYLVQDGTIAKYGIDRDGDGSPYGADCNDRDPSIHPGATEVKLDGVDQDCNGYDLTILVSRASFNPSSSMLRVEATSGLGAAAGLEIAGLGPMTWSALDAKWVANVKVPGNPGAVTVQGVEGADFPYPVTQR